MAALQYIRSLNGHRESIAIHGGFIQVANDEVSVVAEVSVVPAPVTWFFEPDESAFILSISPCADCSAL